MNPERTDDDDRSACVPCRETAESHDCDGCDDSPEEAAPYEPHGWGTEARHLFHFAAVTTDLHFLTVLVTALDRRKESDAHFAAFVAALDEPAPLDELREMLDQANATKEHAYLELGRAVVAAVVFEDKHAREQFKRLRAERGLA
ncbi:MAG: hypothetical protein GY772_21765 [bacterium]|nr:hypothetical protein [bacterium]